MEKFEGAYDDLLADYGLSEEDIIKARQIFDSEGEAATEDWLQDEKGLNYSDAMASIRALKSSREAHQDSSNFETKHDWPRRGY